MKTQRNELQHLFVKRSYKFNVQTIEEKEKQSLKLKQQTIDYLNSGGKITKCPPFTFKDIVKVSNYNKRVAGK